MAKTHVTTTINGEPTEFLCEGHQTLLDVLRDELGLTGSKEGCSSGDCGACSVTVDDRLVCSCLMLASEAEGHSIETIEGMAKGEHMHPAGRGAAVRFLHARPAGRGEIADRAASGPDGDRGALLAGRQSLPLHWVRQGHQGRAGRGRRDAW